MRRSVFVLMLSLALVACGDSTTGPVSSTYSLDVQVHGSDGKPVEGLTVAVWNLSGSLQQFLQDDFPKRAGLTAVAITLPQPAICWLATYDLDGNKVESTLEDDTLLSGEYREILGQNPDSKAGVEVYRYELVAQNVESGKEIFRDSKYMTVVEVDPAAFGTGKTDANGRYFTTNRKMVPGLYELPEMPALDETSLQVGTFSLDDSVTIKIYDDRGKTLVLRRAVTEGRNAFEVNWDPQPASALRVLDRPSRQSGTPKSDSALESKKSALPAEYKLGQNYPNPYG